MLVKPFDLDNQSYLVTPDRKASSLFMSRPLRLRSAQRRGSWPQVRVSLSPQTTRRFQNGKPIFSSILDVSFPSLMYHHKAS